MEIDFCASDSDLFGNEFRADTLVIIILPKSEKIFCFTIEELQTISNRSIFNLFTPQHVHANRIEFPVYKIPFIEVWMDNVLLNDIKTSQNRIYVAYPAYKSQITPRNDTENLVDDGDVLPIYSVLPVNLTLKQFRDTPLNIIQSNLPHDKLVLNENLPLPPSHTVQPSPEIIHGVHGVHGVHGYQDYNDINNTIDDINSNDFINDRLEQDWNELQQENRRRIRNNTVERRREILFSNNIYGDEDEERRVRSRIDDVPLDI